MTDPTPRRSALFLVWIALPLLAFVAWNIWWPKPGPPANVSSPAVALPGWEPQSAEDRLLDEAVGLLNRQGAGAHRLLGPAAVFDDQPVSEADADARQADFYLRHPKTQITGIRRGELTRGKLVGAKGRYTLTTKVEASTPSLRIRNEKGVVGSPSRLFMINPAIVVELRDGKVHAVRAELNDG